MKTPRWTKTPWNWLVWTSTLLRAVVKIQKFTAQGAGTKTTCDFRCNQHLRIRRFWTQQFMVCRCDLCTYLSTRLLNLDKNSSLSPLVSETWNLQLSWDEMKWTYIRQPFRKFKYEEMINETNQFRVYFLCLVEFEHTRKSSWWR